MGYRPSPAARGHLVEREREFGAIDRALADAVAGQGSLLVLEGPAGIGKTALMAEARRRSGATGVLALSAVGVELESRFPYGVVRQLFEQTMRDARGPRKRRLLSGVGAGVTLVDPDRQPEHLDPVEQMFGVVHGLFWLVTNVAAEAPVALLVDDTHWADIPSLRFFAYLARRLDGMAATVIVSVRTGEPGSDRGLLSELEGSPAAHIASPEPLSEAGVASVLSADFGRAPDTEFTRSCMQASGGNPFLLRELAAALVADMIEPTAEAAESVKVIAPQTIARATLTRLGLLSEDAVGLGRALAVLGRDARLPRAASLADLDAARALDALDALVATDVVTSPGELDFRHPIVRSAIYDELAPGLRSGLHRRAAAILRGEGADVDAVAAHLLCSEAVGDPETIATFRDAASHALELGSPENAATYLARALEEGPEQEVRTAVLLDLAIAEKLARRPAALERFEEVRRLSQEPVTRASAAMQLVEILTYAGEWERSLELLDSALGDLRNEDPVLAVRAEAGRGALTAYDPRLVHMFVERLSRVEELVAIGGASSRPLALLRAGWGASRDEPAGRVTELVERGWDAGRYIDDGESIEMLAQGITALVLCDELDRAWAMIERLSAAAQTSGSVMQYLVAASHAVCVETRRGDLVAAAADLRGSVERAAELGLTFVVIASLSYGTEVLLERPDAADLAALVETIQLGPLAETYIGAMAFELRGKLRFAAGQRTAAIADLRRAGAMIDSLGFTNAIGLTSWRGTLALMLDPAERDEALALADAELDNARRSGRPGRIGAALRVRGLLDQNSHTSCELLEESVAALTDSTARLQHARSLVDLGAARRRRGDRVSARAPLSEGMDLAARCGAVRLADRARAELAATGARPRRTKTSGLDALTPSELRVAQMAATGRTSNEIAQALFVTTATIATHLNRTYTKLGVNSRKQLADALARQPD